MPNVPMLLLALVATILIEFVVLLLLGERSRVVLGSSVVVNMLTNVPLNLFLYGVDDSFATLLVAEVLVVLVEALWYFVFLRNLSRAFVYSALCNAISFLIGILAQLLAVLFEWY